MPFLRKPPNHGKHFRDDLVFPSQLPTASKGTIAVQAKVEIHLTFQKVPPQKKTAAICHHTLHAMLAHHLQMGERQLLPSIKVPCHLPVHLCSSMWFNHYAAAYQRCQWLRGPDCTRLSTISRHVSECRFSEFVITSTLACSHNSIDMNQGQGQIWSKLQLFSNMVWCIVIL